MLVAFRCPPSAFGPSRKVVSRAFRANAAIVRGRFVTTLRFNRHLMSITGWSVTAGRHDCWRFQLLYFAQAQHALSELSPPLLVLFGFPPAHDGNLSGIGVSRGVCAGHPTTEHTCIHSSS